MKQSYEKIIAAVVVRFVVRDKILCTQTVGTVHPPSGYRFQWL